MTRPLIRRRDTSLAGVARCVGVAAIALAAAAWWPPFADAQSPHRTFASPEDAVQALAAAVKSGQPDEVAALFAPDGQELVASSDPATGRRNREVFMVAFAEGWRLVNQTGNRKTLVIGNEAWPFPVPLVKEGNKWRFDTAAGKEEVLARRIGRNELAAIATCRTYVSAQVQYAKEGHDGKPAGLYAKTFNSDPGKQNGLYWPPVHGKPRSPLGDLVAQAAEEGSPRPENRQSPFHGYYFRILTGQGAAAPGGARSYVVDGEMSGGFALVAWPTQYDATGVMTFLVNKDGVVRQKDLGPGSDATARAMTVYDADASWTAVR